MNKTFFLHKHKSHRPPQTCTKSNQQDGEERERGRKQGRKGCDILEKCPLLSDVGPFLLPTGGENIYGKYTHCRSLISKICTYACSQHTAQRHFSPQQDI